MKKAALALVVLALLGVFAPAARAGELDVQVDVGFDGAFVEDAWVPVRVTLTLAAGASARRGRVVCEPLPLERVPGVTAPFALESTREAPATSVVVLAVPARGDLSFSVRVEDEAGREIARGAPRDLPRRIDGRDRLVLLVGRRSGLSALDGAVQPVARSGQSLLSIQNPSRPGVARVARLPADELPDRSWVIAASMAVFLEDGPGMVELARDEARVAALAAFVRGGGTLVVVGGRGVAFWANSALDRLLPVDAKGATQPARVSDLAFLGVNADGVPLSEATVRPGLGARDLVLREPFLTHGGVRDGRPLAIARDLGRGTVVFLAFDPDNSELRGAPELPAFLSRIAPPAKPKPPFVRPDRLADLTTRELDERPSLGPAGLAGIGLATVLALVILGPIGARRRNAPARVLVAPALAAALAALVIGVAALTRGPSEVARVVYAFAESGDDQALVVEDAAVFSGGPLRFDLELEGQATIVPLEASKIDLLAFRASAHDLELVPGTEPALRGIELPSKALAWFRTGAFAPLAARLVAKVEPGGVVLEARDGAIPAGVVLHEDASRAVTFAPTPPIPAGETIHVKIDRPFAELRARDEPLASTWDRPAAEQFHAHLVRALSLVEDELQNTAQAPAKSAPAASAARFPRTWVALPVATAPLTRAVANGAPIETRRTLSVLLVAAEETP